MTPQERRRRDRAEIDAANAKIDGTIPEWPQPRFLTPELEMVAAREISERPLHGVPGVFRSEVERITYIVAEKIARDEAIHKTPVWVQPTFLSVADQAAITRRAKDPATSRAQARELNARLAAHRRYG